MVHQSTRCKKLQRVFLLLYFKKARSGAASEILEQGGGTQCRKERHSAAFLSPRESPRWCTRKSRNECCGFFVAPFPSGRTRTSRKRSCSSRGDWSLKMAAGLWTGAMIERERKRGANNVRRARRSLARGRVPGNVAGVERRGDGERQGLEIKKVQVCKSAYGNNKFDGSLLRNF